MQPSSGPLTSYIKSYNGNAGVKRMGANVHTEAGIALREFLDGILRDVVIITEHAKRHTATVTDILLALKRRGR
jgi:histone H4